MGRGIEARASRAMQKRCRVDGRVARSAGVARKKTKRCGVGKKIGKLRCNERAFPDRPLVIVSDRRAIGNRYPPTPPTTTAAPPPPLPTRHCHLVL